MAWPERQKASFTERDVAGIHVHHEHAETLEVPEDGLHFLPLEAELLLFLRAPIDEYLLGKVGRLIEIGALSLMDFDGRFAIFALAADGKYVTMNSRSEGIAKNQTICLAVFLRAAKKLRWIAHEGTADKSFGPFRGRADSLVRERPRLAGGAARPEVPDPENSRRSSSLRRRNCHVNRRPREPLGGAFAQRHTRGGAENRDFRSLTATRTGTDFNSATAVMPWSKIYLLPTLYTYARGCITL